MEVNELRDCTDERLVDLEKTLRRQIFEARIKNHTNQLDDTASIRRTRRDLARVLTVISERRVSSQDDEVAAAESASEAADVEEAEAAAEETE